MPTFKDLLLVDALIKNISDAGYNEPTHIQNLAMPHLIQGKDLLGIAQTGTGKTAAFCLPIIQKLIQFTGPRHSGAPRALILAPTRELCLQLAESISVYAKGLMIKAAVIYGGVDYKIQVTALNESLDIIVATPGRLLDLLKKEHLSLSDVQIVVLDEADRMLEMGLIEDINLIMQRIPDKRQTILFSATMPPSIEKIATDLLIEPIKVQVAPESSISQEIEQKIIFCKSHYKLQLLKKLLRKEEGLTLVFTTSKKSADLVLEDLYQNRIPAGIIHADKKQSERERHLANFKNNAVKVLVATDIASRGIDVDNVTLVINFDLPISPETYVHRIGRTGRAGNEGKAVSFCDESEIQLLEKIKKVIKQEIITEKYEGKPERVPYGGSLVKRRR